MEDLPFKVEYAKSGRAGCKGCKQNIGKDTLRVARMVQVSVRLGQIDRFTKFVSFVVCISLEARHC